MPPWREVELHLAAREDVKLLNDLLRFRALRETELPFGVTRTSLIDSILAANAKGKIKIKHVDDNTADK
ncbi:MAG: topoisomerase subunit [Chthoniobacter sp.]|jgi:hypothetical protein|nr:topoisomerase subunit [Chthoniobacter sp.]